MSKLSFRARALDASKPLPVFRCEDLPDLHEYASINRAVPQMPTGMEKEEESGHSTNSGLLSTFMKPLLTYLPKPCHI
uniref:Enhancer of polycomb homolog 1 n=1 Tax=Lynx canadensis TaxID=61383 RepID=A0A667HI87_LYNCA